MGLFNFFQKKSKIQTASEVYTELLSQASAKTGIPVNYKTVLQLTTAQACARVIAEDIAQIPFKLFIDREDGGSDPAKDHPIFQLIKRKPNDWQSSFDFREQIGLHLVIKNNAYIWLNRVNGKIVELLPFEPEHVNVTRKNWELKYEIKLEDGRVMPIPQNDIWHIRGPSWNGYEGLDGVRLMRESVGLALALEEHGARMFSNGATVGGLLSTDESPGEEQIKLMRESWQARQSGVANAYKTAVMWGGFKWQPMGSQNDQAQFLETRRFQVEETCRGYKVLPIMVGHSDKASTYASAEQMFMAHLRNTMGPWLTRIEQSADCNLLTDEELAQGYHTKFMRNAYLASVAKDRGEFYAKMYGIGALNPNEIRGFEDMNPYDGGEKYRVPLNMEDPENPIDETNSDDQT